MNADRDVLLSIINTLPDAVLILGQERGKFVGANGAFLEQSGLTGSDLDDLFNTQLIDLSLFSKGVKRGLLKLYVKAMRGKSRGMDFQFPYSMSGRTVENALATADRFAFGEQEYVLFTFKKLTPSLEEDHVESWKACLALGYEPYMEFRPSSPLMLAQELEERMPFLRLASENLQVKFANQAAAKLYGSDSGFLEGKTFASFFNDENDAFRFLDMLAVVGQMKAETAVTTAAGLVVQVEMNCVVKFDDDGAIAAVYCGQRDLSGHQRYEAIIGGSRVEMDFTFNQPFVGFAFLTPAHPIERPQADDVDGKLDHMLNQIMIMRANQAMCDIHGTSRAKFLMKPMADLFSDGIVARQVMKELFVVRTTSVEFYSADSGEFERVSIFRATFDDADRLNGVLVVTSEHKGDFTARHCSGKP